MGVSARKAKSKSPKIILYLSLLSAITLISVNIFVLNNISKLKVSKQVSY
jgi:hypothetical protein